MTPMPKPRTNAGWIIAILLIIAALIIYVLSTGPAMVLYQAGVLDQSTYLTAYAPLVWVSRKSDALARLWNRYDNFCLDLCGYPPERLE